MNRKINSIIAIVVSIIIIGIMLFLSLSKEKTQADIINEQLRKQNASWIASDYPKEITNIKITQTLQDLKQDQENNLENHKIFNQNTKDQYLSGKNKKQYYFNIKTTGLFLLTDATISSPIYEYDDNINWKENMTNNKNQARCGACNIFALLGAIEGYINNKNNLTGNNKLDLSEQYLVSYTNFAGCRGAGLDYYIKFVSLNENVENTNQYFKNKIKGEIGLENKIIQGTNKLQTRTLLSIDAGEIPFGVPLENQLPYLAYDSCEIGNLNQNTKTTSTNMNILPLLIKSGTDRVRLEQINAQFCPDNSDDGQNLYSPKKNNNLTKYFISDHFIVDTKNCKSNKIETIQNIKDALFVSPLATSIIYYDSMSRYRSGIWTKIIDEDRPALAHGVTIVGWGTDKIRNKEYWILKNNWGDSWGENGYFRVWIGDPDLELECSRIFGFSGELISKSGKEINDLLPIVRQEIETEKLAEIQRINAEQLRQENLQRKIDNIQQPTTPIPNFPNDINPLREYQILNINYQDTKYISDIKCKTIMDCMSNKLAGFYGNNQGNELT